MLVLHHHINLKKKNKIIIIEISISFRFFLLSSLFSLLIIITPEPLINFNIFLERISDDGWPFHRSYIVIFVVIFIL